jgi:hypothetical protein
MWRIAAARSHIGAYLEDSKMDSAAYVDILSLLLERRDIISEAQFRGLPTLVEGADTIRAVNRLMDVGIVNHAAGSPRLTASFLTSLENEAPGWDFKDLSDEKIARVLSAWSEQQ